MGDDHAAAAADRDDIGRVRVAGERADLAEDVPLLQEGLNARTDRGGQIGQDNRRVRNGRHRSAWKRRLRLYRQLKTRFSSREPRVGLREFAGWRLMLGSRDYDRLAVEDDVGGITVLARPRIVRPAENVRCQRSCR